jgi:hypothetical protein
MSTAGGALGADPLGAERGQAGRTAGGHVETMVACDFRTVDTLLFTRQCVLVFIEPATRRLHVAGITAHPTARGCLRGRASCPNVCQAIGS